MEKVVQIKFDYIEEIYPFGQRTYHWIMLEKEIAKLNLPYRRIPYGILISPYHFVLFMLKWPKNYIPMTVTEITIPPSELK